MASRGRTVFCNLKGDQSPQRTPGRSIPDGGPKLDRRDIKFSSRWYPRLSRHKYPTALLPPSAGAAGCVCLALTPGRSAPSDRAAAGTISLYVLKGQRRAKLAWIRIGSARACMRLRRASSEHPRESPVSALREPTPSRISASSLK